METLSGLDQLDLEPAVKGQVSALMAALVGQARQEAAAQLKAHAAEIAQKDFKIQALTHELAYYKRIRFNPKTETLSALQRDVFEETWDTDIAAMAAELEALKETPPRTTVAKAYPPRTSRRPLPEHLPRIEHRHEPASCTCGQCGGNLTKIRDDITEQLDVEPAKFFVHPHIRPQEILNRGQHV
jgi:transposase